METKQVIVLRKDLNMRKGKMVAQGAHASLKVFLDRMMAHEGSYVMPEYLVTDAMKEWMRGNYTKICVGVETEEELLAVFKAAKSAGLPVSIVTDVGATEFKGVPTRTAVAIGPDTAEKIDAITGNLKLL